MASRARHDPQRPANRAIAEKRKRRVCRLLVGSDVRRDSGGSATRGARWYEVARRCSASSRPVGVLTDSDSRSQPGPMIYREIWWVNQTHFSGAGLVEPCAAGRMGQSLEETFSFELAMPGDPTSGAGTPVTDWRSAGGRRQARSGDDRARWRDQVDLRAEPPSMDDKFCP